MNLREVRKKIKSVSGVKKITKAMQMVSAVKMRKAIAKSQMGKLYREILFAKLQEIATPSVLASLQFWGNNHKGSKHLKILLCANKGLCGSFNLQILKKVVQSFDSQSDEYIIFGKKAIPTMSSIGANIIADFSQNTQDDVVDSIFALCKQNFIQNKYERVSIFFNKFISASKFSPTSLQILPLEPETMTNTISNHDYQIEPSPHELLPQLLEDTLKEQLRLCYFDSQSSEHSARMLAMKNSTDSAAELVADLTKVRNKFRQAQITNELLDATSSKAAFTN